jgi:outer membrane lipoprotein carrier protein
VKTVWQTLMMAGLGLCGSAGGSVGMALGASAHAADNPASYHQAAHHQPAELTDAERLTELLADLNTFTADVRQLIVESTGGVLEESRIRFMLRRPHGLYWETLEPFPELIVTDGQSLWNYQPDLLQLTIEDWNADRTELAAQLLGGQTEALGEEYTIEATANNLQGWEFLLTPYDPASLYQNVMLYFEDNELVSILLVSTNGQRTFWEFNNRRINQPLDASLFTFEIPDDDMLDILDNRQAQHPAP